MLQANKKEYPITMTCICCPIGCTLVVSKSQRSNELCVAGNKCPRGAKYAIEEVTAPKRLVTSVVRVKDGVLPVVSVKTDRPAPKEKRFVILDALREVIIKAPINIGDMLVQNIAKTGVNIIATRGVSVRETRCMM